MGTAGEMPGTLGKEKRGRKRGRRRRMKRRMYRALKEGSLHTGTRKLDKFG